MKISFVFTAFVAVNLISIQLYAQSDSNQGKSFDNKSAANNLYIDVHHLGPGKVKYEDVAKAHAKDLAVEKKYGVNFIKYWVDEKGGNVYCLSSAPDTLSIRKTHAEAHGLLPEQIYMVKSGTEGSLNDGKNFFLDVHNLGPGKVTAKDVAAAHQKDLAVEQKYGVNFINYWVNEKQGIVVCFSQAPDSLAIINTHKEAHGLVPDSIMRVQQGE
jgi:phenolic acid decarboxylase